MATVEALAAKYPKFKDISKFKQLATELGKENPKISYYCLFRIAEKLNRNFTFLKYCARIILTYFRVEAVRKLRRGCQHCTEKFNQRHKGNEAVDRCQSRGGSTRDRSICVQQI